MPDPTKPVGAGGLQRFQHRRDPVSQLQVSMADDGRGRPARTVQAAGAGSCQPLDKLDLANRAHFRRSSGAVHGSRLDKHSGTHVVATVNVGDQFVKQIPLVGDALGSKVPEVMMRVADWNLRLQCWFPGQGQPVISSVRHNGSSVCVIIDDAPFKRD